MPHDLGLSQFAPHVAKRGSMFSARRRLGIPGQETTASPLPEAAYDTYLTSPDQTTTTR
jgi:hypothetical protein